MDVLSFMFTIAGGLGLSRNPADYAPVALLILVTVLFTAGYRMLRKRFP